MIRVCTIVGARPQFIKAATVSRVMAMRSDIEECIVHTGQHYDLNMSQQFFSELQIPDPKYHLNIGSATHAQQTGMMLAAIESVLQTETPDWVLIYGDTNSTLAGALTAAKMSIPVAHVEAGLRSFNRNMPEEINRITADHLSTLLFPPTTWAYHQLLKEGMAANTIRQVGDVMLDATLFYNEANASRMTMVDTLDLQHKPYYLATIHRAENTDDPLRISHICQALIELTQLAPVVLPLHPRTRATLAKLGLLSQVERELTVIAPVGYLDMLALEKQAQWIITDSGGVQKEAYFNQVPCITLRDETEWVELVQNGWNQLCSPEAPFSLVSRIQAQPMSLVAKDQLYGDGHAAEKIVEELVQFR